MPIPAKAVKREAKFGARKYMSFAPIKVEVMLEHVGA